MHNKDRIGTLTCRNCGESVKVLHLIDERLVCTDCKIKINQEKEEEKEE